MARHAQRPDAGVDFGVVRAGLPQVPPQLPGVEAEEPATPHSQQRQWAQWRASSSRDEAIDMLLELTGSMQKFTPRGHAERASASSGADRPQTADGGRKEPAGASAASVDLASTRDDGTQEWREPPEDLLHDWGAERNSEGTQLPTTTLMVRNIPDDCTIEDVLGAWPIDGTWDFLYLPMNAGGKSCLGYAFVNFVSELHAAAFFSRWQASRLPQVSTGRCLKIVIADVQGFDANVQALKHKPAGRMKSRQCRPIIIRDGRLVSLNDV